jgi:flavorubredoxin
VHLSKKEGAITKGARHTKEENYLTKRYYLSFAQFYLFCQDLFFYGSQYIACNSVTVDTRAHWNAGLEKALVELLHEHNNDCYRGPNGWSSEAWNKITKLFNEKFLHIKFTKVQIQDKEKDLKRDYKLLKQAKGQSGSQWNEKLGRTEADPPIWANIINVTSSIPYFG